MCRVVKYEMVCEKVQGYNTDIIDQRMNSADNIAQFITIIKSSVPYTRDTIWDHNTAQFIAIIKSSVPYARDTV